MILRAVILSIATASAMPIVLESHGGPVPEEAQLRSLLATASDADHAADLLLKHYQDHGFPAIGVEVNDSEGQRRVEIDVARYGEILLGDGPERTRKVAHKSFSNLAGHYLDQNELEQSLRNFHANPLHRAVPRLQPSPDGTRVEALFQIEQSRAQNFSAGYHDTGADPLPRERVWVEGEFADLWGRNSLTLARLTTTFKPEEYHAAQVGTRLFNPDGSELDFNLSYSGASGDFSGDYDAYTWQVDALWQFPVIRFEEWKGRTLAGVTYRKSNNALEFGDALNRGVADVLQFSLSQTMERKWTRGLTRINGSFILSPFGDDEEHDSLRPGAEGTYRLARLAAWHRQNLARGWDFVASFGSQWVSDPVLQADQLALGGANGLRGLPEQFALGDKGYISGLELRTPVIDLPRAWRIRPSVFLQTGNTIDMVNKTHTSASTSGFGLQLGKGDQLRASLYAGWRLDEGGSELHSQLTWNF